MIKNLLFISFFFKDGKDEVEFNYELENTSRDIVLSKKNLMYPRNLDEIEYN